jgi:hypothetical protein
MNIYDSAGNRIHQTERMRQPGKPLAEGTRCESPGQAAPHSGH